MALKHPKSALLAESVPALSRDRPISGVGQYPHWCMKTATRRVSICTEKLISAGEAVSSLKRTSRAKAEGRSRSTCNGGQQGQKKFSQRRAFQSKTPTIDIFCYLLGCCHRKLWEGTDQRMVWIVRKEAIQTRFSSGFCGRDCDEHADRHGFRYVVTVSSHTSLICTDARTHLSGAMLDHSTFCQGERRK